MPTEDKYDFVILTLCIFYRTENPVFPTHYPHSKKYESENP